MSGSLLGPMLAGGGSIGAAGKTTPKGEHLGNPYNGAKAASTGGDPFARSLGQYGKRSVGQGGVSAVGGQLLPSSASAVKASGATPVRGTGIGKPMKSNPRFATTGGPGRTGEVGTGSIGHASGARSYPTDPTGDNL